MKKIKRIIPINIIVPFLLVMAVILIALTTNSWGFFMFDESSRIKKNMEEYMRTTYGKEFVLTEPRLVGGGWGRPATTYISRDVYPADDPEIKFDVSWDTKQRTYEDNYLAVKWSTEGKKVMAQKLREVYGEGNFFIRKYFSSWNDAKDQKFTWQDVMKNRSEHNRIDLHYSVFFDGGLDRKKEAQRAYKLLKEYFIDYKVMQYNFAVLFIYKDKKEQLINIYTDEKKRSQVGINELHKAGLMKDWIRVNYTEGAYDRYIGKNKHLAAEVKSVDDLLNTRFQIKEGK
jgi:hypothetical protein